ncbi:MAG: DUF928 domain-containing protein [Cyanobacteria bacterium P01_H01_bin.58]
MKSHRHIYRFTRRCAVGLLCSSTLALSALPAIAQSTIQLNLPDLSAPGNRESGSTRESESCVAEKIIALVPESNYGETQKGYPTFYAYVPATTAKTATFRMVNEATGETFYEGKFSVAGDAGIVGVTLPDNGLQQAMEVGQSYYWYLGLICDGVPTEGTTIESLVTRVSPKVDELEAETAELPALYAEAGLWYDALAASADLRASDNLPWNTLLDAVALETLITSPMLSEGLIPQATGTPVSLVEE